MDKKELIICAIVLLIAISLPIMVAINAEKVITEKIITQVKQNYQRICEDFYMDFTEIETENSIIIGCEFINDKNQSRLWTSYIQLEK